MITSRHTIGDDQPMPIAHRMMREYKSGISWCNGSLWVHAASSRGQFTRAPIRIGEAAKLLSQLLLDALFELADAFP